MALHNGGAGACGAKSSTLWYLGGKEREDRHLIVSLEDGLQRSFTRPHFLKVSLPSNGAVLKMKALTGFCLFVFVFVF